MVKIYQDNSTVYSCVCSKPPLESLEHLISQTVVYMFPFSTFTHCILSQHNFELKAACGRILIKSSMRGSKGKADEKI